MPYDLRGAFTEGAPPLGYRFGAFFFAGGFIPNPLDIRFKKVSGLDITVGMKTLEEGGVNLFKRQLPERVEFGNLVLERGLVVGSPLVIEFNVAMSFFKFAPSNVLVTLLDDTSIPIAGWLFLKAFPAKWAVSPLDAESNTVVIETMELAYERMQPIRI